MDKACNRAALLLYSTLRRLMSRRSGRAALSIKLIRPDKVRTMSATPHG